MELPRGCATCQYEDQKGYIPPCDVCDDELTYNKWQPKQPPTVCISGVIGTTLAQVETEASRRYGGTWQCVAENGIWKDPLNPGYFIWLVRQVEP